ncbi:hemerythrin domain-containing protein [Yoonia sp. SDW83-1]|uniref:hemerythrin domain-containing protein n=1 Tax=Yoonia sp. SDW83-1 TaxID=3366945 RepID=UPI00398C7A61
MTELALETREGLPDALRVLLEDYPREAWEADPGFDGLIRFWLDRHLMFRRLMDEMRSSTEALIDHRQDPERYRVMVSRYGGMFVNGLHEHHTIEDTYYFPKLSQRDTRISRGFDILDSDHHAIDGYLNSFVEQANTVISKAEERSALQTAAGAFQAQLSTMERLLNRHLLDEEELIVPVILKYGTVGLG